jgi:hypothetical protein
VFRSLKIRNSIDSQEDKLIIVGFEFIFDSFQRREIKKGVDKT